MPSRAPLRRPLAAAALAAGLIAGGCGESPAAVTPSPTARPAEAPLRACAPSSIPETGFVPDPAHGGTLTVGRYSPNGDIQAALVYFHLQTGIRQVYTNLADVAASTATPAAGPAGPPAPGHDLLVTCDALEFPSSEGAQGFVAAFRQLRLDARQQEVTAPAVGDRRVAFSDQNQDFAGYPIRGARGAEIAAAQGSRFYSVSVFGAAPTLQTATAILQSMLASAR